MRRGTTFTGHFQLETKQHELLGLDLGEGVPRRALVLGTVAMLAWAGLLFPLLGNPNKATFSLYFLPPILLVTYGMQPSKRFPSRRRLTDWALRGHYLTRGHRPLIRLGARVAHRGEYLPIRDRFAEGAVDAALRAAMPWRDGADHSENLEAGVEVDDDALVAAGRPIVLTQRARLLDQEQLFRAYERTYSRRRASRRGASHVRQDADIPAGITTQPGV